VRLSISHSTCTAEDAQKIRGRFAEDPRESRAFRSTPGRQLSNFGRRPLRKIRGRHRGGHLVPPAPFRAVGPVFQHCGLRVALLDGGLPGGHRVAGHRVATNPQNCFACTAEDPRKTPAEVIIKCPAPATEFFNPPCGQYSYAQGRN
jgi:hypothetical protein